MLPAVVLVGGVTSAMVKGRDSSHRTTTVHGVIGSEKEAFFADPDVQKILARNGCPRERPTASTGSRPV